MAEDVDRSIHVGKGSWYSDCRVQTADQPPRARDGLPFIARRGRQPPTPQRSNKQGHTTKAHEGATVWCLVHEGNGLPFTTDPQRQTQQATIKKGTDTIMGKFIVGLLACIAALGILVYFVGQQRLGLTAFNVPATEHTGSFGISWYFIGASVIGLTVWRLLKK